ncbi:MAG TPA: hypothetical protein VMU69_33405, partial [Bradyrhizobium sp.]|nr:hypothetical protein [Bradyrhizobium sp.]
TMMLTSFMTFPAFQNRCASTLLIPRPISREARRSSKYNKTFRAAQCQMLADFVAEVGCVCAGCALRPRFIIP